MFFFFENYTFDDIMKKFYFFSEKNIDPLDEIDIALKIPCF